MAEQKRPDDDRRRTPFVNDAADAPDQEPPGDADLKRRVAAEKALEGRAGPGTIPQHRDDPAQPADAEVKTQND